MTDGRQLQTHCLGALLNWMDMITVRSLHDELSDSTHNVAQLVLSIVELLLEIFDL
jgi:hypothetical protein